MQLPEKRKPASGKTGSLENRSLATIDTRDNTGDLRTRQASRILARFPVSVPVALAVARLAYGGAA